jgi:hypothetical protein
MQTKEQATERGKAVLKQMRGPGWKLVVHENLGWHWTLRNGKMSLSGSYLGYQNPDTYHVLITDDDRHQGAGSMNWRTTENFTDPNDAVYHAIEKVKDFTEKTLNVFVELCDYLDSEKRDRFGKLNNWTQHLLEPLKKTKKKKYTKPCPECYGRGFHPEAGGPGGRNNVCSKCKGTGEVKEKQFISGKKITRKEALEGLGNPATWEKDKKRLMKEMNKKPKVKK